MMLSIVDILVYGFMALVGLLAITCAAIAVVLHIRDVRAAREAARYERQERFRNALKAQQTKDRAICVEWVRVKLAEKDAEWIARVLVMERNAVTRRVTRWDGEAAIALGWI